MSELRTHAKLVRFTVTEFAEVERRARAAGRRPASYLCESALAGAPPSPNLAGPPADLLHALAGIGADLRAIAASPHLAPDRTPLHAVLDTLVNVLRTLTNRAPAA
jgi:hypothetical protein